MAHGIAADPAHLEIAESVARMGDLEDDCYRSSLGEYGDGETKARLATAAISAFKARLTGLAKLGLPGDADDDLGLTRPAPVATAPVRSTPADPLEALMQD